MNNKYVWVGLALLGLFLLTQKPKVQANTSGGLYIDQNMKLYQ